jgi:hypothetical protein
MMKDKHCIVRDYIAMVECEIVKWMEYETHCGGTAEGEAYLHHLTENHKHAMHMMGGNAHMAAAHDAPPANPGYHGPR